jgi:uncharacterized protein YndB with AHSA1/START domain
MNNSLTAKATVDIHAVPSKVWDALTNPAMIKQYLFGTEAVSTWKVGESIVFKGVWDGKPYEDKGTIKHLEKEKELQYTYWSSFSSIPDIPENYMTIRFLLSEKNDVTTLALTQDNCRTEESRAHSEKNWNGVLEAMKKLLETGKEK